MAESDALLEAVSIVLEGVGLHGELLLKEQSTYWHKPEFLRNNTTNEIGRIDPIPWNPVLDDQNDANLRAVTDEDENGEVFLVNVIQLKGATENWDHFAKFRLSQSMSCSRNRYRSSNRRSYEANNPNNR